MTVQRLARPLPTLALFASAVLLTAVAIVQAIQAGTHPRLLADALTIDLIVTVPLVYWFLAIRRAGWPRLSVVPVIVLTVAGIRLVPGLEAGWLLPWLEWVAVPAELVLLSLVARRAIAMSRALRATGSGDALESLRRAATELVEVERAADIVAYEAAILWYALAGGGSHAPPPGAAAFGVRRRSGYGPVLVGLFFGLVAEAIAVHFLVRRWSVVGAWILTLLTAYAVLWLIGDFRALGRRSVLVTGEELIVRLGLRWTVRVPLEDIRAVRAAGAPGPRAPDHLRAVILGDERQVVELESERVAIGLYGIRRRVRSIGLSVDEPERFLRCLAGRRDDSGS